MQWMAPSMRTPASRARYARPFGRSLAVIAGDELAASPTLLWAGASPPAIGVVNCNAPHPPFSLSRERCQDAPKNRTG